MGSSLNSMMVFFFMAYLPLTQEEGSGKQVLSAVRVVAAMNFGMAIQAAAPLFNKSVGLWRSCDPRRNTRYARCTVAAVALVADHRGARFQQVVGSGAVRHVAVAAIIADRPAVMHERAAFLCVAGGASLNHRVAFHQLGTGRTVRVVTIGTAYFAFQYRMMRWLVDLRALLLVAGETHFGLGAFVAHLVMCGMYLVA